MKTVIVYADESGTHDPLGRQKNSELPTIAGYAAPPSEWSKFCVEWEAVLKAYKAPYFHFREWSSASSVARKIRAENSDDKKNPYYGWDIKRLDKFLLTLASIAGRGNKAVIAGTVNLPALNKWIEGLKVHNPEKITIEKNPFKFCMGEFFRICHRETFYKWGDFKCPVSFFFDQKKGDSDWIADMYEVFYAFKEKDKRMSAIAFADKKQKPHFPLQAADMLAYRLRQIACRLGDYSFTPACLDRLLLKNMRGLSPFLKNEYNKRSSG